MTALRPPVAACVIHRTPVLPAAPMPAGDTLLRTVPAGAWLGLIPPAGSPALPMDRIRDLILRGFGGRIPRTWGLAAPAFPSHDGRCCEQEFPCLLSR